MFSNFEPDRTPYAMDATNGIVNALPVKDGWGPLPDLTTITEVLGSECKGATFVRSSTGAYRLFAGTTTGLYELNATDYSWTDVSGPSAPYTVPSEHRWSFTRYGDFLVASNLGDDHQYIGIDSGTAFADLPGAPPKAKFTWVAGEYFCLGHIADYPSRVMTSGIGDVGWWTVGQRGCDFQDFPEGDEIMGGIGGERGATIIQRTMIRAMNIAAVGDFSFTTQILNPSRGAVAPLSIAQIGPGQFFYYSADGFFLGAEGTPIGAERVDRWFQSVFDSAYVSTIRSVADPFNKIVWTQAQDTTGAKFLLGYNWQLDRWCSSDSMVSEMCVMVTPGISWDGLDALYASIDDVDAPFDSALFAGGSPRFAAFDTNNRLGFFTGAAKAATLETADIELAPGSRAFLQQAELYGDGSSFTMQIGTSEKNGGPRTWGNPVAPYGSTGLCHFRSPGRFHRFRLNIPGGADWQHVTGIEPKFRIEGQR